MEAITDESSFSRTSREQNEGRYHSGNLVLWGAAIAVLIGLNFASWSFCMWVFGQPEHPMNYSLLTKLEKLEPIHGFTPVAAPRGKFYSAKDLYAEVYPLGPSGLGAYNGIRKRSYIQNYVEAEDITYISGEFRVLSVQRLQKDDIFPMGLAVRAVSTSFPDLVLDLVLPTSEPPGELDLQKGAIIEVGESTFCAAVLHVHRPDDVLMVVTATPLVTRRSPVNVGEPFRPRSHEFGPDASIVVTTPPAVRLEPECWPVSSDSSDVVEPKPVELMQEEREGEPAPSDP